MNIAARFQNLSGMFKGLWANAPAVEILEPEQEPTTDNAKDEIVGLMTRIGNFLNDLKEHRPSIDSVTSMSKGYLAVTTVNNDNTARQVVSYSISPDEKPLSVTKETSLVRKDDNGDFSGKNSEETLIPVGRNLDEDTATKQLAQIIVEDISDTLHVDQVALVAAVQGGPIVESFARPAPEALTAD